MTQFGSKPILPPPPKPEPRPQMSMAEYAKRENRAARKVGGFTAWGEQARARASGQAGGRPASGAYKARVAKLLAGITEDPGQSTAELAEFVGKSRERVYHTLSRMQVDGLIYRQRNGNHSNGVTWWPEVKE